MIIWFALADLVAGIRLRFAMLNIRRSYGLLARVMLLKSIDVDAPWLFPASLTAFVLLVMTKYGRVDIFLKQRGMPSNRLLCFQRPVSHDPVVQE